MFPTSPLTLNHASTLYVLSYPLLSKALTFTAKYFVAFTNASYQIVEPMAADAVHFFLCGLPTYSPCFNNSFSRIACHPNKDKASTCSGFNIIRFLPHIKPAFEKFLFEHALDAWVAKRRLAMVATRGHKYSRLRHHSSADILLS